MCHDGDSDFQEILEQRRKNAIDLVLKELGELWKQHPEQRFGQLLENYVFPNTIGNGMKLSITWFQEDGDTLLKIRQLNAKKSISEGT
jgi:hypothetical protein